MFDFYFYRRKKESSKMVKGEEPMEEPLVKISKEVTPLPKGMDIPNRRVSTPPVSTTIASLTSLYGAQKPDFDRKYIPLIRHLCKYNDSFGLALQDLVQLTNTGHTIQFDKSVPPAQADKMRRHLNRVTSNWVTGCLGLHGIINKLISQVYISGAISVESIPYRNLKGIDYLAFVNTEQILFKFNSKIGRYEPYQENVGMGALTKDISELGLKKLNTATYKYVQLNGDGELPYGYPPMLTALEDLAISKDMDENIRFIVKQFGLMGFLELLLEKPGMRGGESESAYQTRLERLLRDSKESVLAGLKEGVSVGFDEDHKYTFHSTTKNMGNIPDIYDMSMRNLSNGLKYPGAFMGLSNKTETNITIIFTKMLSQLSNIQEVVSSYLTTLLSLELHLAGFQFDFLTFKFNPSTITDNLKIQQAKEIQLRNLTVLYNQGIISQETFADEMGYEEPDMDEPRLSLEDPIDDSVKKSKREADKDKSDRKGREKTNPQPKRKDSSTKPV